MAVDDTSGVKRAAKAGFFGTLLEYYEMYIFASASALIFGTVFFPSTDPALATLLSLSTFAVAFVVRPIAAVALGHLGDRLGRKRILLFTLFLMGAATFVIGCIPSFDQIGYWGPGLLVLMRVLQGISAAGEQAGSSTLTLEHAPPGRRAFYSSWTPSGSMAGFCLATLVFLSVAGLPDHALYSWGWRIPFWASAVVVVIAYYFRRRLEDPEAYESDRDSGMIPDFPVLTLIKTHPAALVRVILCSITSLVSTVFSVFGLAFATSEEVGVPRTTMLLTSVVAISVAVVMPPIWGILADRYGRKPTYISGLLGCAVSIYLYFWAISTANIVCILLGSTLLMGVFYASANGLFPSFYSEMFHTGVRFSGMAVGTQTGWAIAGFAPMVGWAIIGNDGTNWLPIALMVSVVCLVGAAVAATAPETYRTPLNRLGNKID
ncbi:MULTISPECIES: MFS transporter [unclassified Rhodococcus (in: high G+C Gram-positive bacteria)]|uniref:MFS transporter n=1 Tax=unclassified Rhodococcus (in: high G+C Gram-positive bacteria) TaxID=192944 RepID=UPI000700D055|nr:MULTISPECIES: MFS transporter [unclassified Rhodococcus (in: high G+C Gram-positive bacteria)]KQU28440.1 MFS transporter [Rhodococcus sp. Leaf225]KQU47681.1 MFS transporter [Rhodococcus sp. Leaf258]